MMPRVMGLLQWRINGRSHLSPFISHFAAAIMLALSDPSASVLGISCVHGNTVSSETALGTTSPFCTSPPLGRPQDLTQVGLNICRVLQLCGRTDIPVYLGAQEPLVSPAKPISNPWFGRDGLGVRLLAPSDRVGGGSRVAEPLCRMLPTRALPSGRSPSILAQAPWRLCGSSSARRRTRACSRCCYAPYSLLWVSCLSMTCCALQVVALGPLTNIALALHLDPSLPQVRLAGL